MNFRKLVVFSPLSEYNILKIYFKGDDRNTRINPHKDGDGAAFANDDNDNIGHQSSFLYE